MKIYIFLHWKKIIQNLYTSGVRSLVVARKDTRKSYNQKITRILDNYGMLSIFSTPTSEKSLQIADFYSWAIFSKFEHDKSDYFNNSYRYLVPKIYNPHFKKNKF